MLLDASRAVTAFQRAAAVATAPGVGCEGTSGSGVDELPEDDSIWLVPEVFHSFIYIYIYLGNAHADIIAVYDLYFLARSVKMHVTF